jgi:RecB family exonuclease
VSDAVFVGALGPAQAWLREHAPAVVVAPTRRAADAFVREMAADAPLVGVERRSLDQWAVERADHGGRLRLSGLARRALMVRALADTELEYFDRVRQQPGLGGALVRTLDDRRRFPSLRLPDDPRGRDLERLRAAYDALRCSHQLFDTIDAMQDALPPPPGVAVLVLGIAPSDPVAVGFFRRMLADRSGAVWVTDGDPSLARRWHAILDDAPVPDDAESAALLPERSTPPTVRFLSAPDAFAEATEVVRWTLELGRPFDRIAIALRHPDRQQGALHAALDRAGVPVFFARGTRRPHPAGRALLALMRFAEEDLSATRFAEYLSFGQVPPLAWSGDPEPREIPWCPPQDDGQLSFSSRPPPPPPATEGAAPFGSLEGLQKWERWLVDAAVVGGSERWGRRLAGLEREFRFQAEREDPASAERGAADAASVARLRRFALPLIQRLEAWRTPTRWSGWLERLRGVAADALVDPAPVLAVLAELEPMAEVGPVDQTEVRLSLMDALGELREEPGSDPYGAVFVGTPTDLVGRRFDAVAVPGVVEGSFPPPLPQDPLLPELVRTSIDAGFGLRSRTRREERRAFAACTAAAADELWLSFPRISQLENGSQVPSQFALEAWAAVHGTTPTIAELQQAGEPRRCFGAAWWVVPEPGRAVDPSEYDLAVAAAPPVRGSARYLVAEETGAARALRARFLRWRSRPSQHDGLMKPGASVLDRLRAEAPSTRPHSATGLQTFADCPYKFWLSAILRFRPRPPPLRPELLDPLTRGSIQHELHFRLHQHLSRTGQWDPAAAIEAVDALGDAVGRAYEDDLCPAIPAVFWRSIASIKRDVRLWVRRRTEGGAGIRALHAELSFGLPLDDGHAPESRAEPVCLFERYWVRGSIDRVESGLHGLRIVDLKTGRDHGSFDAVGGGRTLQPMLYGLAAEQLLDQPVARGALEYATLRADYLVREIPVDEPSSRDRLRAVLEAIDAATRRGWLPALPQSGACRSCDFRSLCGEREERRARGKDQRLMPELDRIRGLR